MKENKWENNQKSPRESSRLSRRKFLLGLGSATLGLIGINKIIKKLNLKRAEEMKNLYEAQEIQEIETALESLNDKKLEKLVLELIDKVKRNKLNEHKKIYENIENALKNDKKKIKQMTKEKLIKYANITLANIRIKLQEMKNIYIEIHQKILEILDEEKAKNYDDEKYQEEIITINRYLADRLLDIRELNKLNINLQIEADNLDNEISKIIREFEKMNDE
jgi:hypothetical protein